MKNHFKFYDWHALRRKKSWQCKTIIKLTQVSSRLWISYFAPTKWCILSFNKMKGVWGKVKKYWMVELCDVKSLLDDVSWNMAWYEKEGKKVLDDGLYRIWVDGNCCRLGHEKQSLPITKCGSFVTGGPLWTTNLFCTWWVLKDAIKFDRRGVPKKKGVFVDRRRRCSAACCEWRWLETLGELAFPF